MSVCEIGGEGAAGAAGSEPSCDSALIDGWKKYSPPVVVTKRAMSAM